jgi:hypothetical protein
MVEDTTGQVLPTATGFAARQARLQRFESATLKSRRCSDASVFQNATWTIVNVASRPSRK